MKNRLVAFVITVITAAILAGCGGGGVSKPPSIAGNYSGDIVLDEPSRGGGETISFVDFTIDEADHVTGTASFNGECGSISGTFCGNGNADIKVSFANGNEYIAIGNLPRTNQGRGGPLPLFEGTIAVTHRLDGEIILHGASTMSLYVK